VSRRRQSGPFRALGAGRVGLNLEEHERALLRDLLEEFRPLVEQPDDPSSRRLFPTAYLADAEREREYQQFMQDEMATARRSGIDVVAATMDASELDDSELQAWLRTLNAVRLVLGTRLDVSEDTDPAEGLFERDGRGWRLTDAPDAMTRFAYLWLSELLESAVNAAGEALG
jgi:hypothetical protein